MAKVGFVGLGVMGGGIARRLLDAGHELSGWNRTVEKAAPLVEAGMVLCDSPRTVAERSGGRLLDGHEHGGSRGSLRRG